MATVARMAIGMERSGRETSSARWVAESRQAKTQFGLMRPTRKARPSEGQPVELTKLAKTNLALAWEGAVAGTVMRITAKEMSEM